MRMIQVALPIGAQGTGAAGAFIEAGHLVESPDGRFVLEPPAVPMVQQVVRQLDRLPSQRTGPLDLSSVVGYGTGLLAI